MVITAAVVGFGVMGRNHARILAELPDVRLQGVYDSDAGARERVARAGWPVLTDLRAAAGADLVVVAVPTSGHRAVTESVLRPGACVLVEKPLAGTVDDGAALLQAASAAGARVGVGHVERFNPVVIALGELIEAGHLGTLYGLAARRLGPFPPRIGDAGVVVDLATHDLDAITHLHPVAVTRVHAELHRPPGSPHEHMASAILRFEDGVIATVEANWVSPTKVRELSVTGERGMFLGNYLSQELTFVRRSADASAMRTGEMQYLVGRESVEISLARAEPLRRQLEAVVAAVREDRDLPVTGEDGLRVLRLAHAVKEAGMLGSAVTITAERLA